MATPGRHRTRTRAAAAGVLLVLSPVALAACGGDEDPTSPDANLDVQEASDSDSFCAAIDGVDLLHADATAKQAAAMATTAGALTADAPAELQADLRSVANSYGKLAMIQDDMARGVAYIGSDILDAAFPIVKWQSDNC